MIEIRDYQVLIEAIDAISDYHQNVALPAPVSDESGQVAEAVNRLLERLAVKLSLSNRESDSLAAASIRMVLLADVQERLNRADRLVKTAKDLKEFFAGVLADLVEMIGARRAIYVPVDGGNNAGNFLVHGVDDMMRDELKHSDDFHRLVTSVISGKAIINSPGLSAVSDMQIFTHPLLAAPLWVNGRSVGIIFLIDKADGTFFNKDDLSIFEHLLPDILRVLERIELLRALEQSNRSLHAEQLKQQVLIKKLESAQGQLLQSEKMASIGQLAAGVAHEINNPIGYVYSNLSTLEKYLEDIFRIMDDYEIAESLISDNDVLSRLQAAKESLDFKFLKEDLPALMNESKEGITRVKKIVQDLKDFSHSDATEEWRFVDILEGINSTLNIVNNEIKYKAEVIKKYDLIPEVECLSSQLNQVFMNLLVNAAHAIEERGVITIRTGRVDDEVWIEVADTGIGIAQENMKRIFDPFFTTKPVGKGTGLGLSLSYGIVQKHHGRIEVQSKVGAGTAFRVCLPINQSIAQEKMHSNRAQGEDMSEVKNSRTSFSSDGKINE
ncbi:ATP-binding protein [Sulfuriferula sp. AH1]|uniref:ATP-binding protein n=1 Tax=Sulfuriferula sp. AH1 TaxID=1985873 RepID=UPI001CB97B34|nr:ATP-binding protein [Sulfuriferula sp. AH1]